MAVNEVVVTMDPEFMDEVRRIRQLLEERRGTITEPELSRMVLDAVHKNTGGLKTGLMAAIGR